MQLVLAMAVRDSLSGPQAYFADALPPSFRQPRSHGTGQLMPRLFVYGTLMCPDVFEMVSGLTPVAEAAQVKNHRCLLVRGEKYPGMVRAHGQSVAGLVYTFPSYLWPCLDAFEGEMYMKKPVTAWYGNGKRELVQCYLFRPEFRSRLSRMPWDYEAFLARDKAAFMQAHAPAEGVQAGVMKPPFRRP